MREGGDKDDHAQNRDLRGVSQGPGTREDHRKVRSRPARSSMSKKVTTGWFTKGNIIGITIPETKQTETVYAAYRFAMIFIMDRRTVCYETKSQLSGVQ